MKTHTLLPALGAGFLLAACAVSEQDGGAVANDPAAATLTGEACPDKGMGGYFFWMEPRAAQPGDQLLLAPAFASMPGAYDPLPGGCVGDIEIIPEGHATLRRREDGFAILTVDEEAPAGTMLMVSASYPGGFGFNDRVEIYVPEESPLVGYWRQLDDACPADSAVRELVFSGGGGISVTWTPFEAYKDYWGDYSFDPATGAFSFTPEGGNQVPEDIVTDGTARLEGETLIFEGVHFGTPRRAESGCRAPFVRSNSGG